jgi:hypothetical protein
MYLGVRLRARGLYIFKQLCMSSNDVEAGTNGDNDQWTLISNQPVRLSWSGWLKVILAGFLWEKNIASAHASYLIYVPYHQKEI